MNRFLSNFYDLPIGILKLSSFSFLHFVLIQIIFFITGLWKYFYNTIKLMRPPVFCLKASCESQLLKFNNKVKNGKYKFMLSLGALKVGDKHY